MNFSQISTQIDRRISISNLLAFEKNEDVVAEIFAGLLAKQKRISSRFFYDPAGSLLFEKITSLPEYYPSRTEKAILQKVAAEIMQLRGRQDIVELGSGDCSKISILLESLPDAALADIYYVPVDVSESAIVKSARELTSKYPAIRIHGLLADFMKLVKDLPGQGPRLISFFGSTLGNLTRIQMDRFLKNIRTLMRPGDRFVMGLDMVKEVSILEAAYNDRQGITAAFNKNILNVINRVAGTNFDPELFDHVAFYNNPKERIEMHLRAKCTMVISSVEFPAEIVLKEGETIHTENSHKFTLEDIKKFAKLMDLNLDHIFSDPDHWFSLVVFKCAG